jgi:hypothetical protein
MAWGWVTSLLKFVNTATKAILPKRQEAGWLNTSQASTNQAIGKLNALLATGDISLGTWGREFRDAISGEYIRQYLVGHGGRKQMDEGDWKKLAGMIDEQARYLQGFEAAIQAGELTPEQVDARARMYVNSAIEAYGVAREENAQKLGMTEMLWEVDSQAENCEDCLAYAAMGWVSPDDIPTRPGMGATICKTACRCSLQWRNPETGRMY